MSDVQSAADYWSAKRGYSPNWYSFYVGYICRRITGDSNKTPTPWAVTRALEGRKAKRLLEIGCLDGSKVAGMAGRLAEEVAGIDIAADAIARGRALHGDRVQLDVVNLNEPKMPRNDYEVILANGVLHHIDNIKDCLQALYDSLLPGGFLIASEFTGPRRYVYTQHEIDLINEGKMMLPEELRGESFDPIQLKSKLVADPSEAVTTRELKPAITRTFDEVEALDFGGNILMRALTKTFFANFDPSNPDHRRGVADIERFDEEVSKREPSHHTFFIARKAANSSPDAKARTLSHAQAGG